jgi:O-antigen ligase
MGKQETAKRKKIVNVVDEPSVRRIQPPSEPKGFNSMSNWLVLLILILPITYSTDVLDSALVPRYVLLGEFLVLFKVYFFFIRKRSINFSVDKMLKLVFGVSVLYSLWVAVTLASSINPVEGYYEVSRSFLNVLVLFLITTAVREEASAPFKLCKALTLMAIIQSFVGILQYYDLGFTYLPGNFKPYGLMANRNLFGSGQMYLLPFSIFVLYQGNKIWKFISVAAIIGLAASLFLSQTRASWLGAAAILAITLILVSIYAPELRKKWLIGSAISLSGIAFLVSLLLFKDNGGSLTQSVKDRAVSIAKPVTATSGTDASISDRLAIWRQTTYMIRENPLFGVGVGNWRVGILKYGSVGTRWSAGEYVPDRVHNVYLQSISETGFPGAILYIGMWVLIILAGFKALKQLQSTAQQVLIILMLAGLVAFAIDSCFSFPNERIEHTLYILIMAGTILGSYARKLPVKELQEKVLQKGLGITALVIIAINLVIGFAKQSFEKHAAYAEAYNKVSRFQETIAEVEAGKSSLVTLNPNGHPLELYSAEAYRQLKQYDKALEEIRMAMVYHPYSARIKNTLGTIYTNMQQYEKAIPVYEQARSTTPDNVAIMKNLAVNYFNVGKYSETIEMLEKFNKEEDPYFANLYRIANIRLAETGQKVP